MKTSYMICGWHVVLCFCLRCSMARTDAASVLVEYDLCWLALMQRAYNRMFVQPMHNYRADKSRAIIVCHAHQT